MERVAENPLARGVVIAVAAGLFMSWAGPFGTDEAPFALRLAYWAGLLVGGTFLGLGVYQAIERWNVTAGRPWTQTALTALVMSVPYTVFVWAAGRAAFPDGPDLDLVETFPPVLIISAVMSTLNLLAGRRPVETHGGPEGAPPPRFLDRLPPKLRGAELYAVEAEDHYLRLHTSKGSDLILMRLSDAIVELDGIEGARTHRSWWVARDAVVAARRGDGRAVLALKSGAEAPVSRSYAKTLRDEGWF
jgi:hypothetical protein